MTTYSKPLATDWLDSWLTENEASLIWTRRDLHEHPELGFDEVRTTGVIVDRLRALGLEPVVLPGGTGAICDIVSGPGPIVALRADIDALPLP
ncbi:MAG: amidohydrolase family protein, partial [Pseudonocardiales bacterium]|nr:amidohydrolase family protein [Pseudonocardiales bacterium]